MLLSNLVFLKQGLLRHGVYPEPAEGFLAMTPNVITTPLPLVKTAFIVQDKHVLLPKQSLQLLLGHVSAHRRYGRGVMVNHEPAGAVPLVYIRRLRQAFVNLLLDDMGYMLDASNPGHIVGYFHIDV